MQINSVSLKQFRNHTNTTIQFGENLNILWGENAQGKTNVLEGLYLFMAGRSPRTSHDKEMIKNGESSAKAELSFCCENRNFTCEIVLYQDRKKQIKVNDIKLKKTADLIGTLNMVYFHPGDLAVISGGPSLKRKMMDVSISQLRPNYYRLLSAYQRVLRQRNQLLKEKKLKTLNVWDESLSHIGAQIIIYRQRYIERLQKYATSIHSAISANKEKFMLCYVPSFYYDDVKTSAIEKCFFQALENERGKELKVGTTLVGPHRDDIAFFINEKEMKQFASQGQIRSAVLSLKLSEMEFLFDDKGEYPIVLLDDIMSELDKNRRIDLLQFLRDKQVIMTCTDYEHSMVSENTKIFHIKNGQVVCSKE